MKTIRELSKSTNSLQSMLLMNASESNIPEVGMFVTTFYYTDRRSSLIVSVEGNKIITENGGEYYFSKRGLSLLDWEGKKRLQKNVRITRQDMNYTDPSF